MKKKTTQIQMLQLVTISRRMEMLFFFKMVYRGWAQF